ncbi:hypothetical protein EON63_18925 [archaeon]|nr:MAG: hypothetical protein EON63_18925 [archaeon]
MTYTPITHHTPYTTHHALYIIFHTPYNKHNTLFTIHIITVHHLSSFSQMTTAVLVSKNANKILFTASSMSASFIVSPDTCTDTRTRSAFRCVSVCACVFVKYTPYTSYTLHIMRPTPYTIHYTSYTINYISYTLHHIPYTREKLRYGVRGYLGVTVRMRGGSKGTLLVTSGEAKTFGGDDIYLGMERVWYVYGATMCGTVVHSHIHTLNNTYTYIHSNGGVVHGGRHV